MNKYLDLLSKIKECRWSEKYLPQLEKIELYVKGEITSQELMTGADNTTKKIIYLTINKLLNYEERDVRYFVKLPQDMFFNTSNVPCILAGRVTDYEISDNHLETIGPSHYAKNWSGFYEKGYIEITGDFSKYPEGVMLFFSDWFKIISKYPNLYERMYNLTKEDYEFRDKTKEMTFEQVKERVDRQISRGINSSDKSWWVGKEEAQYIPQEVIDSIKFIIPVEYLSVDQVLSGNFGTFEEVAKGIRTIEETREDETTVQQSDTQSEQPIDELESEDDIIRVGLGELVEYVKGSSRKYIAQAIDLDMQYMTEKSVHGSSKKELVIMLADFVLNYKGDDAQSHLFWLGRDHNVVNGRICDIPIIKLAKLNSSEIATQLSQLGAEDVKTTQSEDRDLVASVANLLGYGRERRSSMADTMSVISDGLGINAEEPFKKNTGRK